MISIIDDEMVAEYKQRMEGLGYRVSTQHSRAALETAQRTAEGIMTPRPLSPDDLPLSEARR